MKKALSCFVFALALVSCGRNGSSLDNPVADEPALTTVSAITGTADRRTLVGRKVSLQGVTATAVVGDVTFWVGTPQNQIPVVLEGELRNTDGENAVRIQRNKGYDISGTLRLVQNEDLQADRLLDNAEMDDIEAAQLYILADQVSPR